MNHLSSSYKEAEIQIARTFEICLNASSKPGSKKSESNLLLFVPTIFIQFWE